MSIIWKYTDSGQPIEEGDKKITFHDEYSNAAGEITTQIKTSEKTNSLFEVLKARISATPSSESYTFADSKKKVHAIADPSPTSRKIYKQILYYKNNKSEKINVYRETTGAHPGNYCFEYEGEIYTIQLSDQKRNSIQQILLKDEVVAATMREHGKKLIVQFKTEEKFKKDSWLWLSVLHSLFTKTKNQLPFSMT